jgi:hypothetical protein
MPISIEVTLYVNHANSDRMNSNIRFNGEVKDVEEAKKVALELHRLSEAIGGMQAPAPTTHVSREELAAAYDGAVKAVTALAEVPNEKPKSETTSSTSQASSPESAPVTYDDVKRATNAVSKINREKAIAGLARFGVTGAMKLTEQQWPEYIAYMTQVAAGEIDPEASHE